MHRELDLADRGRAAAGGAGAAGGNRREQLHKGKTQETTQEIRPSVTTVVAELSGREWKDEPGFYAAADEKHTGEETGKIYRQETQAGTVTPE